MVPPPSPPICGTYHQKQQYIKNLSVSKEPDIKYQNYMPIYAPYTLSTRNEFDLKGVGKYVIHSKVLQVKV